MKKVFEFMVPVFMSIMLARIGFWGLEDPSFSGHLIGALLWVAVAVGWCNPWVWSRTKKTEKIFSLVKEAYDATSHARIEIRIVTGRGDEKNGGYIFYDVMKGSPTQQNRPIDRPNPLICAECSEHSNSDFRDMCNRYGVKVHVIDYTKGEGW